MLYFEEWRGAGHYQSLEVDPNIDMNRVLAHYRWRSKCLSQSHSRSNNLVSTLTTTTQPPPSCPTPPVAQATTSPPPLGAQPPRYPPPPLHSTRQRIESETSITISVSPISTTERQIQSKSVSASNLDVTIPPPEVCTQVNCTHAVVYGNHFDSVAWDQWTAANDTISGMVSILSQPQLKLIITFKEYVSFVALRWDLWSEFQNPRDFNTTSSESVKSIKHLKLLLDQLLAQLHLLYLLQLALPLFKLT